MDRVVRCCGNLRSFGGKFEFAAQEGFESSGEKEEAGELRLIGRLGQVKCVCGHGLADFLTGDPFALCVADLLPTSWTTENQRENRCASIMLAE
jgi:hypothetical protein